MANVWAVIEYQHIGANGAAGEKVLSEHPTPDEAVRAKMARQAAQPELVGCLAIRFGKAELPAVGEGAGEDGGSVAAGPDGDGDGVQGPGGGDRPAADVPALRPAGGRVPRRAVESPLP